ncbi:hypothetical protein EDB83DRAFT_2548675 [Lactarius deliciosus]|nr:hypothetical protein EDB83DRAFT_2548675 [Lactarius deliciosus]
MKKKIFWRFENPTLPCWVFLLPFALWVVHPTKHGSYRQPLPSGFAVVSRNMWLFPHLTGTGIVPTRYLPFVTSAFYRHFSPVPTISLVSMGSWDLVVVSACTVLPKPACLLQLAVFLQEGRRTGSDEMTIPVDQQSGDINLPSRPYPMIKGQKKPGNKSWRSLSNFRLALNLASVVTDSRYMLYPEFADENGAGGRSIYRSRHPNLPAGSLFRGTVRADLCAISELGLVRESLYNTAPGCIERVVCKRDPDVGSGRLRFRLVRMPTIGYGATHFVSPFPPVLMRHSQSYDNLCDRGGVLKIRSNFVLNFGREGNSDVKQEPRTFLEMQRRGAWLHIVLDFTRPLDAFLDRDIWCTYALLLTSLAPSAHFAVAYVRNLDVPRSRYHQSAQSSAYPIRRQWKDSYWIWQRAVPKPAEDTPAVLKQTRDTKIPSVRSSVVFSRGTGGRGALALGPAAPEAQRSGLAAINTPEERAIDTRARGRWHINDMVNAKGRTTREDTLHGLLGSWQNQLGCGGSVPT